MIKDKCNSKNSPDGKHNWVRTSGGGAKNTINGHIPTMYNCDYCHIEISLPELLQLEALENQTETLRYLTKFQKKIIIITTIISIVSTLAFIISLIIK